MDDNAEIDTTVATLPEQPVKSRHSRLVTDDLQGRVNALASALIMQGYEPTFVRLRAGLGRTPQELLQRAFEWWKVNVRPTIGHAPERVSTWGNEIPVPDAIRDLFSETWRRTLIAARMTQKYCDESLEKVTVSEETRAIRSAVDRLERLFAEHHEQRRIDTEIFRTLTVRLAQACAESEEARRKIEDKLAECGMAADRLKQRILGMRRSIDCAQIEAIAILGDWRSHVSRQSAPARRKSQMARSGTTTRRTKRR
jgi:hypothetical protein